MDWEELEEQWRPRKGKIQRKIRNRYDDDYQATSGRLTNKAHRRDADTTFFRFGFVK